MPADLTADGLREAVARALDPGAWSDMDDFPTARHERPVYQREAREKAATSLAAIVRAAGLDAEAVRHAALALSIEDTEADDADARAAALLRALAAAAEGER